MADTDIGIITSNEFKCRMQKCRPSPSRLARVGVVGFQLPLFSVKQTLDEQTNGIHFIKFVCPSISLFDASGCRRHVAELAVKQGHDRQASGINIFC